MALAAKKTSTPSPLEALTATNKTLMARKRKPRAPDPVRPSQGAERFYLAQLNGLVRLMSRQLYSVLGTELARLKPQYTADSVATLDAGLTTSSQ